MPNKQRVVFVGHGHSHAWLELKVFLREKLYIPVEEFNSTSVAGVSSTDRLSELMNVCSFAFLIMTAEHELTDGTFHARQNVIHELGLFQARLGWDKAIVLLEAGCARPSNNDGITYITFPKENIGAAFEKVREALDKAGFFGKEKALPTPSDIRIEARLSWQKARSEFEVMCVEYAELLNASGKRRLKVSAMPLNSCFQETMRQLCNGAVGELSRSHIGEPTISANVKSFVSGLGFDEEAYTLIARNGGAPPNRFEKDTELKASPIRVSLNKIYELIFSAQTEEEEFHVEADLAKLLRRIKGRGYKEPNDKAPYRSFITVPIYGHLLPKGYIDGKSRRVPSDLALHPSIRVRKLGDKSVLGMLCIDSPEIGRFNSGSDLKIMQAYAIEAFDCFRVFYAVKSAILRREEANRGTENG